MAAGTVAGTGGDTTIGNDTLTSVEAIRGTNFIDTYTAVGYAGASLDIGLGANFNEFEGMGGNNVITGNGSTRVSFINSGTSVTVNLLTGTATGTEIGTDTIIGGVSAIRASNSNDTLTGSDNAADTTEAFDGRGGNDSIDGKGGFDRAVYNVDTGTFSGITVNMAAGTVAGTGGDTTIGNDTLISVVDPRHQLRRTYSAAGYTGASADIGNGTSFNEFEGMGGNDTITGNGNTRLTFQNATGGVNVNLAAGTATGDASVGSDTFTGVSRVRGSNFSDSITGNNNNNLIEGLAGNDMLTGGIGNDTFRFNADEGADTITDFQQGQDLIRLDGTFASSSDQAFLDFVAQLHSAGNVDTFSVAGTTITLTNVNVSQLQVSDFVIHL